MAWAGAPSFVQKPAIKQADGGKKVIFECKIKADPKPFLTWFRDDIQLSDGGRYKYVEKEESAGQYYVALELSDPQAVDAATYKLNARNDQGESNANLKLNFDAKATGGSAPKFTAKPVIRQVPNGVVFEVRLTADPAPSVAWFKGDSAISNGGRFTMTTQTDGLSWTLLLQISGVTAEDGGSYKVNAKNKHGESNANINLNLEAPKGAAKIPTFVGAPSITQQGSLTIMLVTVESESEPKASWMKGSSTVSSGGRISLSMKKVKTSQFGFSCEIKDAAAEDGGAYKCIVKNDGGEAVANINLNTVAKQKKEEKKEEKVTTKVVVPVVNSEPVVTSSTSRIVVRYIVESAAEPSVAWQIGGKTVKSGGRYITKIIKVSQGYEVSCEVDKPTAQDAGAYKCTITNEAGKIVKSTNVEAPVEEPKLKKQEEEKKEADKPKEETKDGTAAPKKKIVKKVKKVTKTTDKDDKDKKSTDNAVNNDATKKVAAKKEPEAPKEEAKPAGDAPTLDGKFEDVALQVGSSCEYKMNVKGTAPITVSWTRDGQKVRSSGTMKASCVRGIAKFHIMEAQPEHTGVYKIEAVNSFGECTRTCEVIVQTAEKMKMKKPKQKAKADGDGQDWPDLKGIPLKKKPPTEKETPKIEDVERDSSEFKGLRKRSVDLEKPKKKASPPPKPKKEPSPAPPIKEEEAEPRS